MKKMTIQIRNPTRARRKTRNKLYLKARRKGIKRKTKKSKKRLNKKRWSQ